MKRTNISLTEEQYKRLREEAHSLGLSMSAVVRHALDWYWEINTKTKTETPKEVNIFKEATKEHIADRVQFGNKGLFNPAPKPKKK